MTFILQFGRTDTATMIEPERYFIDDRQHRNADHIERIDAATWKDAREAVRRKHSWLVES